MASQQTAGIIKPLGGVMVSRDDEHWDRRLDLRNSGQKVVKQADRLPGGNGFIVNIPRDEDRVRMDSLRIGKNLREDMLLIRAEVVMMQLFADVEV